MTLLDTTDQIGPGKVAAVRPQFHFHGATLALNAVVPGAVFVLLNGAVALAGFEMPAAKIASQLGVSGWIATVAWVVALTNWGLVRGAMLEFGRAGRTAADWLFILSAAGIAFPFITLGFDLFWSTLAAFLLGLLALGTISRVAEVHKGAAVAMSPSILALLLPGMLGIVIMSMGWTPPFGVTQAEAAMPSKDLD
ncbi:hypothetical protein GCM10007989_37640 [Devosia pacifica]|uniref:Uncharacterized protein n=1 Tax=Devosia pacifica TaxID=1335967 RepID=A0A918SGK3_9HYPH|nr:hypothetical protein [Devosia pacifica]GHA38173.1 hypothetical protein GCM10007989_37640 [Devosia pacifica]